MHRKREREIEGFIYLPDSAAGIANLCTSVIALKRDDEREGGEITKSQGVAAWVESPPSTRHWAGRARTDLRPLRCTSPPCESVAERRHVPPATRTMWYTAVDSAPALQQYQ